MIALSGVWRDLHFPQKRVHFSIIQATASAHRAVTGHRCQNMRQLVFQCLAATKFSKFLGDITGELRCIRIAKHGWNTADKDASLTKTFDFESEAGKKVCFLKDRLSMMRRKIDNFRQKQRLNCHTVCSNGGLHPFHHQPFMRRMLVDDGDAISGFGDDIGLVKLCPRGTKKRSRRSVKFGRCGRWWRRWWRRALRESG